MERAKNLIAFLFQRSGKERLEEKEIYMALSYELRWLTPEKAKIFLQRCLESGLLKTEDGEVTDGAIEYEGRHIHNQNAADIARAGIVQVLSLIHI